MKSLFKNSLLARLLVVAVFALGSLPARALTEAEAVVGRGLVKRYAESIIGVELVVTIKMSMGDRVMPPREQKREINGTVISASGLTVISLGEIDPRGSITQQPNLRVEEPDFKEVKLRLSDNSEVAAQIVMKDTDLDLAFVAPMTDAAAGKTFSFVNLDEVVEPQLLESLFLISRVSKQQQRLPVVVPSSIIGVIEKPRRLVLANNYALGCPAFNSQGKLLGLCLRNMSGGQLAGIAVFTGPDIAEIAKQAAAIKPESIMSSTSTAPSPEATEKATPVAPKPEKP